MIRPGDPLAPFCVWQELQSPDVCGMIIVRVLVPLVSSTVNGVEILVDV